MTQYTDGTVTTDGTSTVLGIGTLWTSEAAVGDLFGIDITVGGNGLTYFVQSITDNTHIVLTAVYGGANVTSVAYALSRDFSTNHDLPLINQGDILTGALHNRAMQILDSLLAGINLADGTFCATGLASSYQAKNGAILEYDTGSGDAMLTASANGTNNRNLELRALLAGVPNANQLFLHNNGSVGLNTSTPDGEALLQMDSTTKGFLPPRMTSGQRDAMSSPQNGLIIWNTTTTQLEDYNSGWAAV